MLPRSKQVKVVAATGLSLALVLSPGVRASNTVTNAPPSGAAQLDFGIFWPPVDPSAASPPATKALLNGHLLVQPVQSSESSWKLQLRITIHRATDEAAREFWNSRLGFSEIDWMRFVRVWDAEQRWLWPNLPYLLRLHGIERVERYGGVDPGKGMDNDFAAVLMREYDASGQVENETTKLSPLVSAEWYPVDAQQANKSNIVHVAQSDEFTLKLPKAGERQQGVAKVWLVYADFMGAKLPVTWPKTPEFAGGVLAFFEVKWTLIPESGCEVSIRQMVPKQGSGFNWERWVSRSRASADSKRTARLSN